RSSSKYGLCQPPYSISPSPPGSVITPSRVTYSAATTLRILYSSRSSGSLLIHSRQVGIPHAIGPRVAQILNEEDAPHIRARQGKSAGRSTAVFRPGGRGWGPVASGFWPRGEPLAAVGMTAGRRFADRTPESCR